MPTAPSVAYLLSKIEDPAALVEVGARVVAEKLSRAETVEAVRQVASRPKAGRSKPRASAHLSVSIKGLRETILH